MKFSIRDLFWLTLVAAFAVLWWIDRGRLSRLQEQVERQEQQERLVLQSMQYMLDTQLAATQQAPVQTSPTVNELLERAGEALQNLEAEAADSDRPNREPQAEEKALDPDRKSAPKRDPEAAEIGGENRPE